MSYEVLENENFDIFISYRHATGFYMAELLYTKFVWAGYSVFMDKTMHSGRYEEKIQKAIKNSKNFLIVLFPDDIKECKNPEGWLNREAAWAMENQETTIIPVMCDGFEWPHSNELAEAMAFVKRNNGISIHKDYSLDSDIDKLRSCFLKNVDNIKSRINAIDFFRYNLEKRTNLTVKQVDVAFHAGSPWLMPGEKKDLLVNSLKKNICWRVLINTVEAAESIGKHMRDETALYVPFDQVHIQWKRLAELYPDCLEVRKCEIPLIHVHHSVKFENENCDVPCGEMHIKYYAYNNTRLDNAFEHVVNSTSKHFEIYNDEFEFLWNKSEKL